MTSLIFQWQIARPICYTINTYWSPLGLRYLGQVLQLPLGYYKVQTDTIRSALPKWYGTPYWRSTMVSMILVTVRSPWPSCCCWTCFQRLPAGDKKKLLEKFARVWKNAADAETKGNERHPLSRYKKIWCLGGWGLHSTEVAYLLLTQQPLVLFSVFPRIFFLLILRFIDGSFDFILTNWLEKHFNGNRSKITNVSYRNSTKLLYWKK